MTRDLCLGEGLGFVPTGLGNPIGYRFPTLKRGPNDLDAWRRIVEGHRSTEIA
jgi:hypothetical protein